MDSVPTGQEQRWKFNPHWPPASCRYVYYFSYFTASVAARHVSSDVSRGGYAGSLPRQTMGYLCVCVCVCVCVCARVCGNFLSRR